MNDRNYDNQGHYICSSDGFLWNGYDSNFNEKKKFCEFFSDTKKARVIVEINHK